MDITKIYSDPWDGERYYSILMDEDEMMLFSEYQKCFNSKARKAVRLLEEAKQLGVSPTKYTMVKDQLTRLGKTMKANPMNAVTSGLSATKETVKNLRIKDLEEANNAIRHNPGVSPEAIKNHFLNHGKAAKIGRARNAVNRARGAGLTDGDLVGMAKNQNKIKYARYDLRRQHQEALEEALRTGQGTGTAGQNRLRFKNGFMNSGLRL